MLLLRRLRSVRRAFHGGAQPSHCMGFGMGSCGCGPLLRRRPGTVCLWAIARSGSVRVVLPGCSLAVIVRFEGHV
eukprot:1888484-Prymnesium_polylepis.2